MSWRIIDDQTYFSLPSLGSSDLKHILRSVAYYFAQKAKPQEPTQAQRLGTLAHKAILQPELFKAVVSPSFDRRTKEGKTNYENFLNMSQGCDVLTRDEADAIDGMRNSVMDHPMVRKIMRSGVAETCGEAQYLSTQLRCKPDWRNDEDDIILDLKTTENATPDEFARSIARWQYHLQMAVYSHVARDIWGVEPSYYWVVVEKEPPYACAVYEPSPHMKAVGQNLMRRAVERWESAVERHAPDEGRLIDLQELELPRWAWET